MNILKSRYFLIAVGTILLGGLVWLGGAWLGWSVTARLIGVIGVLVLCIALLVGSMVRANRAAAGIEQSIRRQAEEQKMSTRPDRRAEIEEVQNQLEQAIARLKESKLGRGRRGRSALYALPWYLFVGPPGAGKTTAIAESGLNFPIGTDRVRGVGGTRNCDWFFSDSAILLDTAGRYMTEEEDAEEWHAFLEALKEHRPDRPVNGVLVGISVADLADADPHDIEWHADRIRRRIDELVQRLGVRFPVYLVFTKCDLLKGFVDFFGDLPRQERQQVWGHTFELADGADDGAEGGGSEDLRTRFEHAYDRLTDALLGRRAERLCRSMKREERRRVYAFPLEVAAVKDQLGRFVSRLFQPNPYEENPTFRGFYFTSGTQEGVPLDRVIESVGQQFDLAPEQTGDFDPEVETKSYFLKSLFTDVVVPDQYLVSQTSSAATRGWLKRAGVGVAAVVLLALFVLGASQALVRSKMSLARVENAAEAVEEVNWNVARGAMAGAFGPMDELRQEVARLEAHEEDPPLLGWGLYRGGRVLPPARQLYYQKARAFIQAYPLQQLEQQLRAAARRPSPTGPWREAVYDDLHAYLLMSGETARLEQEAERSFLKNHLTSLLDSTLLHTTAAGSPEQREALRAQVAHQVEAFVEGMSQGAARSFQAQPALVSNVRNLIYQEPSIAGLYRRIKEEGAATLPPFTLEQAVPRRDLPLFATQPEVPGFFTKTGWKNFAKEAIEAQGDDPSQGDWVLGHTTEDLPAAMRDREKVVEELKARYFGEYAAQWERFLGSARFERFGDLGTAARAMARLASPTDSPVLYLLAQVSDQTTFKNELADAAESQLREAGQRAANRQARRLTRNPNAGVSPGEEEQDLHPVDRRFAALHALQAGRAASGDASTALAAAMEELALVRSELENMQSGDDGKAAAYAAKVFKEDGGELARTLRSIRSTLNQIDTPVRRALFDEPLLYSWGAVMNAAQSHLNERWRTVVQQPYQNRLAGSYPFEAGSRQGAPLMDVENYFHPEDGVVSTFLEEELGPFLGNDMQPRTWEGRGLQLSPAAHRALGHVQHLSEGLFTNGVMRLTFELQPELTESSGNAPPVDQVYISIYGKGNTYRNGSYRPWMVGEWPGSGGVMLSVSTQEGDLEPLQFDGPWALFRLLEEADVQRTAPAQFQLRWPFQRAGRYTVTARYNLRTQSAAGPFADVRSFFAFRPPARLD